MSKVDPYDLDQFDGPLLVCPTGKAPEFDFDLRAAARYVKEHNLHEVTNEVKKMFPKNK